MMAYIIVIIFRSSENIDILISLDATINRGEWKIINR